MFKKEIKKNARRFISLVMLSTLIGSNLISTIRVSATSIGGITPTPPSPVTPPATNITNNYYNGLTDKEREALYSTHDKTSEISDKIPDISKDLSESLSNQNTLNNGLQTTLDSVLGNAGISNTEIYSMVNNVNSYKSLIDEYMNLKYLTKKDILNIKIAMYLSQFVTPLEGNLNNLVDKLEKSSLEDNSNVDLSIEFKDNDLFGIEVTTTLEEVLKFIKSNYYITYVYSSKDGKDMQSATVSDLFNPENNKSFYIKDTTYMSNNTEISNSGSKTSIDSIDETIEEKSTLKNVSPITMLNSLSNKNISAWLPFLDKNIRNNSSNLSIVNTNIKSANTHTKIFSNSYESKAILTTILNQYTWLDSGFNSKSLKETFGKQRLGMDSFGNLVGCDDKSILISVMNNPILMSIDDHETFNLTAYNIKSAYSMYTTNDFTLSGGRYNVSLFDAVKPTSSYTTNWTRAILDYTGIIDPKNNIFVISLEESNKKFSGKGEIGSTIIETSSISQMDENTTADGNYTPYYHWKQAKKKYFTLDSSPSFTYNIKIGETSITKDYNAAILYTKGDIYFQKENNYVSDFFFKGALGLANSIMNSKAWSGSYDWYTTNIINSNNIYRGNSSNLMKYYKEVVTFYEDTDKTSKQYSGYLYNTNTMSLGNNSLATSKQVLPNLNDITSSEIITLLKAYSDNGILNDANIFRNWKNYSNYSLKAIKKAKTASTLLESGSTVPVWEQLGEVNGFCYPNNQLNSDELIKDIAILGVSIYGGSAYENLITETDGYLIFNSIEGTNSYEYYDFNQTLLSIFRNTSSSTERLTQMSELTQERADEFKEDLSMSILKRVFSSQTNPITTALKYMAGGMQVIHNALSGSWLESLFYISTETLNEYMGTFPIYVLLLGVVALIVKLVIILIRKMIGKNQSIIGAVKTIVLSVIMLVFPMLILYGMQMSVKTITDRVTYSSSLKYGVFYSQQVLNNKVYKQEAKTTNENSDVDYFIEKFDRENPGSISISELDVIGSPVIPGDTQLNYINTDITNISDILESLPSSDDPDNFNFYRYNQDRFTSALAEYYDRNIFYYFVDYYINQWVKLKSLNYESTSEWQTQIQSDLNNSFGTFKKFYSMRSNVYGNTASLGNSYASIDDIFGLGQLFYNGNGVGNYETRGYKYPIEYMDTILDGVHTAYNVGDNAYWEFIKQNDAFDYSNFQSDSLVLESMGKTDLLYAPIYSAKRLSALRNTLNTKYDTTITINPQIVGSEGYFKLNGVNRAYYLPIEKKLWSLNENIYKMVCKYYNLNLNNVSDYTDILMLASISSFEFNKEFGNNGFFKPKFESTSFVKNDMDIDMMLKTMFLNPENLNSSTDFMYTLVLDNKNIIAGILLIMSEFVLLLYVGIRMIHLLQIYIMGGMVSIASYGFGKKITNMCWLGIISQSGWFLLNHAIILTVLNILTLQPLKMNTIVASLISLIILFVSCVITWKESQMVLFVFRNWRDMGGQVFANTVTSKLADIRGKLQGNLNGDLESDDLVVNADNVESPYDNVNNEDRLISSSEDKDFDEEFMSAERQRSNKTDNNSTDTDSDEELNSAVRQLESINPDRHGGWKYD